MYLKDGDHEINFNVDIELHVKYSKGWLMFCNNDVG